MFLKTHRVRKDGKLHIYYSLCESLRVSRSRVTQRRVLHLGELNTTQLDRWQRSIETIHEDGQRYQMRLFTDREGQAPAAEDVAEVILSSLVVRRPRRFGECWIGCKLWEELGLREFWEAALAEDRGQLPWAKVVELLAVNRLCAPRSELSIHEKWFGQTAMDLLLDSDARVAEKDRLYRCLDRLLAHKEALEQHLAAKWRDLFGAEFDVLLYDLTSTYFEGEAVEVDKARRGYSRDHRPDCLQLLLAVIVTAAPLLGLLGTVSGLIAMFQIITEHGVNDPKLLAGGIGEALIATETGLLIAIPTLLGHNFLANRVDDLTADAEYHAMKALNSRWPEG